MRKRNLLLAAIFHIIIILPIIFFASHKGILGKKMQMISATLIPKPKIEEPKPQTEQPKVEVPKVAVPLEQPKTMPQTAQTSLPTITLPVAPPTVELPVINFSDGAKEVQTVTDPIQLYKAYIESYIKSQWNIPQLDFETFVEISITSDGKISPVVIVSNTGDKEWTRSINDVLAKVKVLSRPPPKGFPNHFQIKFDSVDEIISSPR